MKVHRTLILSVGLLVALAGRSSAQKVPYSGFEYQRLQEDLKYAQRHNLPSVVASIEAKLEQMDRERERERLSDEALRLNVEAARLNVEAARLNVESKKTQWSPVAGGIEYREFSLDEPNRVFVARADRARDDWIIDTCIGQGQLKSGLESVSGMARRRDDAIDFQGRQYDVKVAINGDYFSYKTHQPPGGLILGSWFVKRYSDHSGGSGFVWTIDRQCFLGGNIVNRKKLQKIIFADSAERNISNINARRGENELILYTPHYADRTYTSDDGVEVLVRVPRPVSILPADKPVAGEIVKVREGAGSTPLPFDHVVLSGQGEAAEVLREHARVGEVVKIVLGVFDYGVPDRMPRADWTTAYASLGGHAYCVRQGKVPAIDWEKKKKPGAIKRHPRTAVAMNDKYVYFVVADGRSKISVGMTFTELGTFCKDYLEAEYAISQDGGGSSTLWVDGKVKNVTSDGKERAVSNGYMMVLPISPKISDAFAPEDKVRCKGSVQVRLGPGTNYAVLEKRPRNVRGVILSHRLNGVRAKGSFWWKWECEGIEGGVSERFLRKAR